MAMRYSVLPLFVLSLLSVGCISSNPANSSLDKITQSIKRPFARTTDSLDVVESSADPFSSPIPDYTQDVAASEDYREALARAADITPTNVQSEAISFEPVEKPKRLSMLKKLWR